MILTGSQLLSVDTSGCRNRKLELLESIKQRAVDLFQCNSLNDNAEEKKKSRLDSVGEEHCGSSTNSQQVKRILTEACFFSSSDLRCLKMITAASETSSTYVIHRRYVRI